MQKPSELTWLFLDLNSYFASVEQQENPALRRRPVAVVPSMTDATCAIAASYEAKAFGVKTGTKIYEAKKLCPDLQLVLARHDVYVDYHHRILKEFSKYHPVHKVWSIDEFSSRLCITKRTPEMAIELAQRAKAGLLNNVGEAIYCSIGLAPNSLLAKMATDMQKPNGLVVLHPDDIPHKISHLPLNAIPGVGANMLIRLNRAGITSMRDLLATSPKQLRQIWRNVQGERIWYWLHGYDFETPPTKKSMIGHSRVLDPQHRHMDMARLMARRLLVKAAYRLRAQNLYAGTLSLGVTTVTNEKWRREISIPTPAQDSFTLLKFLEELWDVMRLYFSNDIRLKKISTLLINLTEPQDVSTDLFDFNFDHQKMDRRNALTQALDSLQKKYKKEVVCLGVTPQTQTGHVGTKIAFNRVPQEEEFWS